MKFILVVSLMMILPLCAYASFGNGGGIVLYQSDKSVRSGVLSEDHKCTDYPKEFKAARVENTGSSHCALWTAKNCKGTLYVVPAHYAIDLPDETIESVIC